MKLNNKGWGLNTLLIISACLFLFLLIAAYYIYVLYGSFNKNNYYKGLEEKLVDSAKKYNSKSKISYNKLKELGYINNLKDENNNECDGYVLYDNNTYTAYINCENYITDGYYANKNK